MRVHELQTTTGDPHVRLDVDDSMLDTLIRELLGRSRQLKYGVRLLNYRALCDGVSMEAAYTRVVGNDTPPRIVAQIETYRSRSGGRRP